MSYTIEYKGDGTVRRKMRERSGGENRLLISLLIATCVLVFFFAMGKERMESILIPGDTQVTKAAFHDMVERVRSGDGIRDAFYCFCTDVVEGANIEN